MIYFCWWPKGVLRLWRARVYLMGWCWIKTSKSLDLGPFCKAGTLHFFSIVGFKHPKKNCLLVCFGASFGCSKQKFHLLLGSFVCGWYFCQPLQGSRGVHTHDWMDIYLSMNNQIYLLGPHWDCTCYAGDEQVRECQGVESCWKGKWWISYSKKQGRIEGRKKGNSS